MKIYQLSGKPFEFDESLEYFDFYLENQKPQLMSLNWDAFLSKCEEVPPSVDVLKLIQDLSRWINEAPRKRFYREMKLSGTVVLSSEYFFEEDGGNKIIDGLENTGKVAFALCNHYGIAAMSPIKK